MAFRTFKQSFKFYNDYRYKRNEYFLRGGKKGNRIQTKMVNTIMLEGLGKIDKDFNNQLGTLIVEDIAVKRFQPNIINNKDFWISARKSFPLLSVCGGQCKDIKAVNKMTLQMSKNIGLFDFLNKLMLDSSEKINVLEIGCGYGNIFHEINDKCNYYGIDYIIHDSLKEYKNFIEIDKSGIPDFLLGEEMFDAIYCVNVLQHCSQHDRYNYLKEGFSVLKSGGYFMFTAFLMTDDNKNSECWGIKDSQGRGYTHFFNQLTECDWDWELTKMLGYIGYEPVTATVAGNALTMIVKKP
jgi:SAM-dependent methyltransferase